MLEEDKHREKTKYGNGNGECNSMGAEYAGAALIERVTAGQRLERGGEISRADIQGKGISGRRNSQCKCPPVGAYWVLEGHKGNKCR